jgi:hypothetical protein
MHFLYIDEAGSTGADLTAAQQPVFVMASLVVSDEKWRKTGEAVRGIVAQYLGAEPPIGFELHASDLLSPNGHGPFKDHERERRNQLAIDLLSLIAKRRHYVLLVPVYKAELSTLAAPEKDWGFDWHHPWQFSFSMTVTMFEEFLRSPSTGRSSTGLVIIDHADEAVDFVRQHTAARQADTGWRQLKKVVEIGYSASSHANPLIQLTDLIAFTLKKFYELETPLARNWPKPARFFFEQCKETVWPQVKFKNPSFTHLNVHDSLLSHAKSVRRTSKCTANNGLEQDIVAAASRRRRRV